MTCDYCHTWNWEDEHRCVLCGRRLSVEGPELYSDVRRQIQAAPVYSAGRYAGDTQVLVRDRDEVLERGEPERLMRHVGAESIEFEQAESPIRGFTGHTLAPHHVAALPAPGTGTRKNLENQRVRTSIEAVIYTDAPVAACVHRMVAAGLDAGMIAIGVSLYAACLAFGGVQLTWSPLVVITTACAVVCLIGLYRLLFIIGGGDTPGVRWVRLRTVTFGGGRPSRAQRLRRIGWSVFSAAAAGMGVLWSLVDEQQLSWHDHLSKTFLTLDE